MLTRGEGLVWLIEAVLCLLAACRGSNCTLTRAIGWPQFALLAPLALANQLPLAAIVKRGWSQHRCVSSAI